MTSRKRSRIWAVYDEIVEGKAKVKCTLCNSLISRSGVGRKASTTAMLNHVKIKHTEEFKNLEKETLRELSQNREPVASTSSSQSNAMKIQQTLFESFTSTTKWDTTDLRAKEIHKVVAEMIALDNQPISMLENNGFQRLMNILKSKYQIPSRKYMNEVVIPEVYTKVKNAVRAEIAKAKAISITTDIWTCTNNLLAFLSYTAHWLDEEFGLQHRVLQMSHFRGPHTADNIRSVLSDLFVNWDIDTRIHLVLRDNGRNVVKAINDSQYVGKGCYIHTLQLAVKASLKEPNVIDVIASARKIIDRAKKGNISLYITDNPSTANLQQLTERQWEILRECITLLKPFEEVTKITSSTLASISEVIPHTNALLKYLSKPEVSQTCPNIVDMKQKLEGEIQSRFQGLEKDKYYSLATLLDPRFRMRFFQPENYELIRNTLFLESVKRSDITESASSSEENESELLPQSQDPHASFWNCFEELASTQPLERDDPKSPIALELDSYLKENLLTKNKSPFEWWTGHQPRYPELARLTRVFLCAPASTVYSERLFSEAGNVYEEKRNRLLPERAESLVFLHHNLPLLNF
ncbi:Zinc finger BED domain-containing protein 4 [Eumeta japonica]|uniref:Zinc finger BED domain-containing protein 4 n=1 Tax=Eumeta variegata TaxID=151549 RepID=A0A4C1ZIK1_EUMVA|nr:Zinc finger BED domain-containing protein 4 [Eumeta japonica]